MIEEIFLKNNNYQITHYEEHKEIHIYIKSNKKKEQCPNCKKESNVIHSTYQRKIQDTPIHNTETWLHVTANEFVCLNSECKVTTFTEELTFARKNQVKTNALLQFILSISIFLSSSCASMILSYLGVKVSPDSIDRIIKNIKVLDEADVEEIGIDDVAIRKGQKYATVIYDKKDHHLLALIEGRGSENVKKWLKEHPKIKVVARDRASAYASAIREVLPHCIQVADRFHLFSNLITCLKEIFYKEIPEKMFIQNGETLEHIPKKEYDYLSKRKNVEHLLYDNSPPIDELGNLIIYDNRIHDSNHKKAKQQAKNRFKKREQILQIRKRWQELEKKQYSKLEQEFHISVLTIKRYLNMSEEEIKNMDYPKLVKKGKTKLDDYDNIIYKMLRDGYDYDTICTYVVWKGYSDSLDCLDKHIYLIHKNNFPNNNLNRFIHKVYPKEVCVIRRFDLLKYIFTIDEKKKKEEIEKNISILLPKYPVIQELQKIFYDFHSTIFSKQEDQIHWFIQQYQERIPIFCNGLKKDIAAVKHAISDAMNSGFVEGNNNKFKLIKRIVYGKSKLCNLFQRSYLSFMSTTSNFDIQNLIDMSFQKDN